MYPQTIQTCIVYAITKIKRQPCQIKQFEYVLNFVL